MRCLLEYGLCVSWRVFYFVPATVISDAQSTESEAMYCHWPVKSHQRERVRMDAWMKRHPHQQFDKRRHSFCVPVE